MRSFKIRESTNEYYPGCWLVYTADTPSGWIRRDHTFGQDEVDDSFDIYFFPTYEEAETALIAAKLRGDAL